ncbi:MAG: hypothetical protein AAB505_00910 [Patescibacteria group bacterium]
MQRNWPALCQIGAKNQLLMHLLATVDLNTDIGKRLTREFNECFCVEPIKGPIPLSVLVYENRERAIKNRAESGGSNFYGPLLDCWGVLDAHNIPYLYFGRTLDGEISGPHPALPPTINSESKTGDVVEYQGTKFVVVGNNDNRGVDELAISPLELIDVSA